MICLIPSELEFWEVLGMSLLIVAVSYVAVRLFKLIEREAYIFVLGRRAKK